MTRHVSVVPHTHWDREWYLPFQSFRLRLVELLDDLLPRLERDPSYAHFLLDGQMAVVDDYLAIRPEAEATLRRLAATGRLAMGPWYVLPDEFLVSGETHIRNLQAGIERAAAFGGAMDVGYLPDMFGHIAQMPQLLRQLGFEHAVVWRGVPSAVNRTGFWWEAPDGSTVRAEYLPTGYGNGADAPEDAKELLDRVRAWEAAYADLLADAPLLWMNGSDHKEPQAHLGRVVAEANELAAGSHELRVQSLAEHLRAAPTDDLPRWRGELRSGHRANLLMGVASNRVDVHQAAMRAEVALERVAEPMWAVFGPPEAWPQALLDEAWRQVIRNAAHDSVCACSHDEVVDAVLHRYAEARQIAEGLTRQALRWVGARTSASGPVVVNTTARRRSGIVELTVVGTSVPDGAQVVSVHPARRAIGDLDARSASVVLADILAWTAGMSGLRVELATDGSVDVTLLADGSTGEPAEQAVLRARLAELASSPDTRVRGWLQQAPSTRLAVRVEDVPGLGWRAWASGHASTAGVVTAAGTTLTNGLVTIVADEHDGTFSIDGHAGFGRLVDGGDAGDTYNYSPPADDRLVTAPDTVRVRAEGGPVVGRLVIDARYRWPVASDEHGRSDETVDIAVTTIVEVCAGERLVRVAVELENRADDHRLRVHVPLLSPATRSRAECAFTVVERGLTAEGGPTEKGLPTFPSRRFVQAGGLTVVHEGLLEYELVDVRDDGAHELALTLLRATRYLSRGPMAYRPLPAGPIIELHGSQVRGRHVLRYGLALGDVDPYAMADDLLVPLLVTYGAGIGDESPVHAPLEIDGAEVSSVRRRGGGLEVRAFNPTDAPVMVTTPGRSGWRVDLRGRPIAPFETSFALGPHEVATVVLSEPM